MLSHRSRRSWDETHSQGEKILKERNSFNPRECKNASLVAIATVFDPSVPLFAPYSAGQKNPNVTKLYISLLLCFQLLLYGQWKEHEIWSRLPQTALKLISLFRSCDSSQRSCQKWVGKSGFRLLFHYMQWSGSISYLNHFSPKLQISYEENKCQKRIFWIEATKFLSFESFKIERSLKLCIQDGHATPHLSDYGK